MFDDIKDYRFSVAFHTETPWAVVVDNSTALILLLRDTLFPDKRMERLAAVARIVEMIGDIDSWTIACDGKPFHFSKALTETDYVTIVRITH